MDANDPRLQNEITRLGDMMKIAGADLTGHMLPLPFVWVNLGCPSNTLERLECEPSMGPTCETCGQKTQRYVHASIHRAAVKNALGLVNNIQSLITDLRNGADKEDPSSIRVAEVLTGHIGQLEQLSTHYNSILEAIEGLDSLERKLG